MGHQSMRRWAWRSFGGVILVAAAYALPLMAASGQQLDEVIPRLDSILNASPPGAPPTWVVRTPSGVRVQWLVPRGAELVQNHYFVDRSFDGISFVRLGQTTARTFVDSAVKNRNQVVHYRVTAENEWGTGSVGAVTPAPPMTQFCEPNAVLVQASQENQVDVAALGDAALDLRWLAVSWDFRAPPESRMILRLKVQSLAQIPRGATWSVRMSGYEKKCPFLGLGGDPLCNGSNYTPVFLMKSDGAGNLSFRHDWVVPGNLGARLSRTISGSWTTAGLIRAGVPEGQTFVARSQNLLQSLTTELEIGTKGAIQALHQDGMGADTDRYYFPEPADCR